MIVKYFYVLAVRTGSIDQAIAVARKCSSPRYKFAVEQVSELAKLKWLVR